MNAAVEVLADCKAAGLSVTPESNGNLYLCPVEALTDELKNRIVANKPAIIEYLQLEKRVHIHRVLIRLRDIKPYRVGDCLQWRGKPTTEQQHVLREYGAELLEILTPRALTKEEELTLALWLHDIGETTKPDRDVVLDQAARSPADRVTLLWMAEGSPGG
jgi:hypothetical protein